MILDTLSHIETYRGVHPRFRDAIAFLNRSDLRSLPEGRIPIDDDSLYATVQRKHGCRPEEAILEAHSRYIDIQVLLDGVERIGWRARDGALQMAGPFDATRDVVLFRDAPEAFVTLHAGMFAIFFPQDAHAPMIADVILHKIVIKVAKD